MEDKSVNVLGNYKVIMSPEFAQTKVPEQLILDEIFPRLPVELLVQLKLVSKIWDFLISSPEFVRTHFRFASPVKDDRFIFLTSGHKCYSLSYDESNLKDLELLHHDLANLMERRTVQIIGSCNGLVCLYSYEGIDGHVPPFGTGLFALWSPVTSEFRKIDPPGESPQAYGYGYASELKDYKIFGCAPALNSDYPYIGVFSLRTGEWKPLVDVSVNVDFFVAVTNPTGALVEGCLHWLIEGTGIEDDILFLVFVLNTEQLMYIPVLDSTKGYREVELNVVQRGLSLCCQEWFLGVTDFFVLKRQGDCFYSDKLYSFSWYKIRYLGFTTMSKCLINHAGQLQLVDVTEADHGPVQGINFDGYISTVTHHVNTLFSPIRIAS